MFAKTALKWYALAFVIAVIDQATKQWASLSLDYNTPLVFTSFFNFTLLHNPGAAFSFLSDAGGWQRWFFGAIALGVSIAIIAWLSRLPVEKKLASLALALILGGALGNLYDRVALGYVVDFIVFHYEHHYWPAFNIADCGITVGAGILIVDMFLNKEAE
jgi:signal peptidase II